MYSAILLPPFCRVRTQQQSNHGRNAYFHATFFWASGITDSANMTSMAPAAKDIDVDILKGLF
jgi:hypothetical protein